VNKAAGNLLMQRDKRIMWMGCAAHAIDLLIKDIGKHDWAKELFDAAREVVKWFKRRQVPFRLFRAESPDKTLLLPGDTRFASNIIMLDRFLDVRKSLKKVVTKQEFTDCVQKLPLAAKSASDDPMHPTSSCSIASLTFASL
jgi:hypothetical protein